MKVFIATRKGQGKRSNDFCFADEGELVTFGSECDGESVDGRCGCRRCLTGLSTGKPTTTFAVAESELDRAQYVERIKAHLIDGGWGKYSTDEEMREWATGDADELLRLAEHFSVGAVIEKRGVRIQQRIPAPTPSIN